MTIFLITRILTLFTVSCPTESSTFEFKQAHNSTLIVRHGDDHVTFQGALTMHAHITVQLLNLLSQCLDQLDLLKSNF